MAKRAFDSSRLNKIIKLLVNIVSVLSLVILGLLIFNFEKIQQQNIRFHDECMKSFAGNRELMSSCIDTWLKANKDQDDSVRNFAFLGLGLPFLYYGGRTLYRYLFPIKSKE